MSVLVLIEHDNQNVKGSSLNTITAAKKIDKSVHAIVLGENCSKVADQISKCEGIEEVFIVDNNIYKNHIAENIAPIIVELASKYSHILAPSSTFGKNIMPRIAALLDVAQISDIMSVENSDTFIRPIYAGNANLKLQSIDSKKITSDFKFIKKQVKETKLMLDLRDREFYTKPSALKREKRAKARLRAKKFSKN